MNSARLLFSCSLAAIALTPNLTDANEEVKPLKPVWSDAAIVQLKKGGTVTLLPATHTRFGGHVAAVAHIDATREEIWDIVAQPERMTEYLGGSIKSCEVLEEGDGEQLVRTLTRFPWLPIEWRYEYETKHEPLKTVRFEYIRGNLRHFEGHWRIFDGKEVGLGDGVAVFYEVYLDPGALVPKAIVRRNLKKDVPNVLVHLREYVGRLQQDEDKTLAAAES